MGLFCIFNANYFPMYYQILIIFLIYSQYLLLILFEYSLNVLLYCYGILSLSLLCTYFLLILLSYLYHLPPFLLPPRHHPIPSLPPTLPLATLSARSVAPPLCIISAWHLVAFWRAATPRFQTVENDDDDHIDDRRDDDVHLTDVSERWPLILTDMLVQQAWYRCI